MQFAGIDSDTVGAVKHLSKNPVRTQLKPRTLLLKYTRIQIQYAYIEEKNSVQTFLRMVCYKDTIVFTVTGS